jgi:chromosome segregation ATPase
MYTFYKTKSETTSQITSLNGTIVGLSEDKNQLILNNSNLTEEISSLNETINMLNDEKASLVVEKSALRDSNANLTSTLNALQSKYNAQSETLATAQSDLADCQAACPK